MNVSGLKLVVCQIWCFKLVPLHDQTSSSKHAMLLADPIVKKNVFQSEMMYLLSIWFVRIRISGGDSRRNVRTFG